VTVHTSPLVRETSISSVAGLVLMRLWQFVAGFFGWYFTEEIFGLWRIIFTVRETQHCA
jgi:hypothetical protein